MALEIVKYEDKYQEAWDQFVLKNSVNGTFLQTRNFLNYHPEGRFVDASVLVMQLAAEPFIANILPPTFT